VGCGCKDKKSPDQREAARQALANERRAAQAKAQQRLDNGGIRALREARR
jgi:hypothetical protein